jgi:hypothetical protein
MKTKRLIAAITVSAGLILGPAALAQEETPVDMKDLPSPAQTTIKEKAGDDQILRVAKETRKGKECYDAVVNKNGKEVAIRVDSNGKFKSGRVIPACGWVDFSPSGLMARVACSRDRTGAVGAVYVRTRKQSRCDIRPASL